MEREKVIRDGKIAVLISPGYGAGWSTWNENHEETLLFHPKIVEMVEQGRREEIDEEWIEKNLEIKDVYTGGAEQLRIEWVPQGTKFMVDEYDGSENLIYLEGCGFVA